MAPLKGKSPFSPGQPVPVELFVGRAEQVNHIMQRGVGQVALGKSSYVYLQGEYGIGKSSLAAFLQSSAEFESGLHGIYCALGPAENLNDVGSALIKAVIQSGAFNPRRSEIVRKWLSKYIGDQSIFGVTFHAGALEADAPSIAEGTLPFLQQTFERLKETGIKGLFLILDEINGIARNPKFAHFIKDIVDTNAVSRNPLPLFLMLCGVEERRMEMIQNYEPIARIFDVVDIPAMSGSEMEEFFSKAFASVQYKVNKGALEFMSEYSAGFPKVMHEVGDAAFWTDTDGIIDHADAMSAVMGAAEQVGKKYVDQQVVSALRSSDYKSILKKIAVEGPDVMAFKKQDIVKGLTEVQKKKFSNFLQKMKQLKVLRSGEVNGEYVFINRMVRLYLWLENINKSA